MRARPLTTISLKKRWRQSNQLQVVAVPQRPMLVIDVWLTVDSNNRGLKILVQAYKEAHRRKTSCLGAMSIRCMPIGTKQIVGAIRRKKDMVQAVINRSSRLLKDLHIRLHIQRAFCQALTRIVKREMSVRRRDNRERPATWDWENSKEVQEDPKARLWACSINLRPLNKLSRWACQRTILEQ